MMGKNFEDPVLHNEAISKYSMSYRRIGEDRFVLVNAVRFLISWPSVKLARRLQSLVTRRGQLLSTLELFSHKPTSLSPLRIRPWRGGAYIKRDRASVYIRARSCRGQRSERGENRCRGGAACTPGP